MIRCAVTVSLAALLTVAAWAAPAPPAAPAGTPRAVGVAAEGPPGGPGPLSTYDREVQARRARFLQEAARPSPSGAPAAIVPLLGLWDLFELVDDREALGRFVDEVAERRGVSPLVRAYAQMIRRELAWRRDDGAAADRIGAELGVVPGRRCQLIGPFDNEGRKGHGTAYPPEAEVAVAPPETTYEGKSRALPPRWRPLPGLALSRDGRVLLDSVLHPDEDVTAYVACFVESRAPGPLPVAVRVGASGAVKVFVNRGPAALDHDSYHPLRVDQASAAATLLPGWNRILVKISAGEGPMAFLLRLTAPDGSPLTALARDGEPPGPGWPIPKAAPAPRGSAAVAQLLPALQAAARGAAGARRAEALRDLGAFLYYVTPTDPDRRETEGPLREAQRLRPTADGARLLAYAVGDGNERRRALEEGLRAAAADDPGRARLQLEIGKLDEESRREERAEAAYREAARLDPGLYTAALHLGMLQANRGLLAEADAALAGLSGGPGGRALRLLRARASLDSRRGRAAEVDAAYRRVLAIDPGDLEAQRQLYERCRSRGDLAGAIGWLARVIERHPELAWARQDLVHLYEGAGQHREALATLDRLLEERPGEAELHELRARLLLRLGRAADAQAALRRSLELRPQNPDLRSYLAHLSPEARSGDDLQRAYRVDPKTLRRAQAGPQRRSADPAEVLLDQTVTRVHDNGLSEVFTQRVVEVGDEAGAREYADYDIRYTPETQSVQVKAARIYKRGGQVQEVAQQGEQDVSEPWYGLYYDVKAATLRFDGLEPGDVLDVEYVVADVGRRNLLSDYFGDLHFLQEDVPRRDSRYVLLVSEGASGKRPLYFNEPKAGPGWRVERTERVLPGLGREGQGAGAKVREYAFRAVNVPRLEAEAGQPGYTEVAAFVHVSTYKSWEDVARWYQGLVREQLQSSPEIARAARAAVAGLRDERARMIAIYELVVQKTRYVGLEFGIHGYKPYKVTQVFSRKFGDCKDKAALLHVMLKEVGIESSMVLARTRRSGDLPAEPASLAAFDHAIVYVPKHDVYLDGTAEFSGAAELPADDQDIPVLIVADPRPPWNGRGHLARTRVLPAVDNTVTRRLDVKLRGDGSAVVAERQRVAGQAASKWREHYQASGEQRERYEKGWNESFPGVKVNKVEIAKLQLGRPVELRGEVEVPAWARRGGEGEAGPGAAPAGATLPAAQGAVAGQAAGTATPPAGQAAGTATPPAAGQGELVLRALGRDPDLLRTYARLSQRRHDLVLGYPWRNEEIVRVELPPGVSVQRLPAAARVDSPFGSFTMAVKEERRGPTRAVTVSGTLEVTRHRIASADYAAFRRFCADVDSLVAQDLVVAP